MCRRGFTQQGAGRGRALAIVARSSDPSNQDWFPDASGAVAAAQPCSRQLAQRATADRSGLPLGATLVACSWYVVLESYGCRGLRILALLTDAYGGHGGIAQYNRDLIEALAEWEECQEVVVLPRLMYHERDRLPAKVTQVRAGLGGRACFTLALLRLLASRTQIDLVLCCHINLLPVCWLAAMVRRVPLVLTVFGIDAWRPTRSRLVNRLVREIDGCIAISRLTRRRFLQWSAIDREKVRLLPNAIRLERYGVTEKSANLVHQYGLQGNKVLLTFGRLASRERYKGFDEMLEALPGMLQEEPALKYVIAGDGEDRGRLEAKARALGIAEQVVFTGFVDEGRKAEFYSIADAYVMPSRGEGFGFVFLEAMACGLPTVASSRDGSADATADGTLAELADPDDLGVLRRATFDALARPKRVPPGLHRFSWDNFARKARAILRDIHGRKVCRPRAA
jgi:phosphatidyl-myo-inositol dimannoside synthase